MPENPNAASRPIARKIHEIDLARVATLSRDEQRKLLRAFAEETCIRNPYGPLRKCLPQLADVNPARLVPETETERVRNIEQYLQDKKPSLLAFRGIKHYLHGRKIWGRAYKRQLSPLVMDIGWAVTYWLPFVLWVENENQPFLWYLEPRRDRGLLNPNEMKFVCSMMKARSRSLKQHIPSALSFRIIKLTDDDGYRRNYKVYEDEDYFSFAELNSMVAITYEIWVEVLKGLSGDPRLPFGSP